MRFRFVRGFRSFHGLPLALFAFILFCTCAKEPENPGTEQNYRILHRTISQPISHSDPRGPSLDQEIGILIPDGAPSDSPVFFNLGNEKDLTDDHLLKYYRLHGQRDDIIYVQAEHRGYGQSLTEDKDQSVPSYVRIEDVLQDTHEVISELRKEYTGPWMVCGWSYGGGLVIEFAYKYPDDVDVVMASSGVIDWPFLDYGYDKQIRETLGDACYKRLVRHSDNLEPGELFDENWIEREFLHATAMGVVQFPSLESMVPVFRILTFLPTRPFLGVMRQMDRRFGDGEAWDYARTSAKKKISTQEVAQGLHNWHVWRYQMCTEIGGFLTSGKDGGLFTRTQDDFCEECRALFGDHSSYADAPEWSQREMVDNLAVPLVYVAGGKDPWMSVCLEPEHEIKNGKYFFVPNGRHCPEREDPQLACAVLEEMLKHAGSEDSPNN